MAVEYLNVARPSSRSLQLQYLGPTHCKKNWLTFYHIPWTSGRPFKLWTPHVVIVTRLGNVYASIVHQRRNTLACDVPICKCGLSPLGGTIYCLALMFTPARLLCSNTMGPLNVAFLPAARTYVDLIVSPATGWHGVKIGLASAHSRNTISTVAAKFADLAEDSCSRFVSVMNDGCAG